MAAIQVLFQREKATLASICRGGTTKWQDHQLAEANGPEADSSHRGLSDCQRPDHLTGTVCFAGFPGGTVQLWLTCFFSSVDQFSAIALDKQPMRQMPPEK
jgi:hypothetical protein